ncbi:MAG: bifunctional UDP-N-acetylglucosamine diphosphorylase/glucosamine-1-phosphate N-acetyltransferase GlmU [Rhodobacteraceae bacterium]|nr:bifunctional UDP-N-acetylglucosamine diphosphorylase/glucosamine-1-phosphate N-acetyltransferase GlmU [Paracoccaceae bacterium]
MTTAIIILAAGQGSRMVSDLPKVMHKVAGVSLLGHAMRCAAQIEAEKTVVVVGHQGEQVSELALTIDPDVEIAKQKTQNGTGDAVRQASEKLQDFDGDVIVLYGDTPFVQPETLQAMQDSRRNGHDVVVLGFEAETPGGYGRLIMQNNILTEIVEAADCTDAQRKIGFCNSGVVCASAKTLFSLLDEVADKNSSGEVYLTDIVSIANARGLNCAAISCDESETLGVNTRHDLAKAEAIFQSNARLAALENGVTMMAPETVYFALDTVLGRDITIEPNVFFGPDVTVENQVTIKANSHLEGCHISEGAIIGPFARLRPGAEIGGNARIGNFVEIKASQVDQGAKIGHLAYVGDAHIGAGANIGAGVIFCNYDGVFKHTSVIGKDAFIGSNTAIVSPVNIGDEALIGSGSVITKDVPADALAIARARQETKSGMGKRLMDRLRSLKAKK